MQQLSGMDAAFVHLETESTPMQVVGVIVLDTSDMAEPFTIDRLKSVVAERLHLMPPFRRRLVQVPWHLDRPYWIEDAPDIDSHVFSVTAPVPGDDEALGRVAGDLAAQVLDHRKPLWEMWLVEGLTGDRVAIVAKMHHATMYGLAGADLIGHIFDLDPVGQPVDPPEEPPRSESPPSTVSLLGRTARNQAGAPVRLVKEVVNSTRNIAGTATGMVRRSIGSGDRSSLRLAPRSSINGALTRRRDVAFGRVGLDDVKAVKNATGGTVNDVILALVTEALRRYLVERGEVPARPLVASVPVAVGAGDVEMTDKIGAMLVPLPIEVEDPVEQLRAIVVTTQEAKSLTQSLGPEVFGSWADLTAPPLLIAGARLYSGLGLANLHRPLQNLVVSNVPGPPIELYAAGARVEAIYPMGPLLPGSGLNITVLSNLGNVDFGVLACPDLVPGCWAIPATLPDTLRRLREGV